MPNTVIVVEDEVFSHGGVSALGSAETVRIPAVEPEGGVNRTSGEYAAAVYEVSCFLTQKYRERETKTYSLRRVGVI